MAVLQKDEERGVPQREQHPGLGLPSRELRVDAENREQTEEAAPGGSADVGEPLLPLPVEPVGEGLVAAERQARHGAVHGCRAVIGAGGGAPELPER
jgi:hypothetical protein